MLRNWDPKNAWNGYLMPTIEPLVENCREGFVTGNQDATDLESRGREKKKGMVESLMSVVCKVPELPMRARSNFSGRLWAGSILKISRNGGRNGVL